MTTIILWNGFSGPYGPTRTIGAYQIAHWIRKNGYSVKVIDFCPFLTPKKIADLTLKWAGDSTVAVGISSSWWTKPYSDLMPRRQAESWEEPDWLLEARALVEEKRPDLKWIAGGAAVEKKKYKLAWKVFGGHAENDVVTWLDQQHGKLKLRPQFDIQELDHRFTEDDCISADETLPIELGRGCKFKCKFCNYPLIGKKPGTYLRSMECVKQEILYNYERWGTTKYYFLDDTVNEDEDKVKQLANLAQSLPFKLSWTGYNRADLIYTKLHTAQWLKDSGLTSAFCGVESLHKDASKLIGKGWSGVHGQDWLPELQHTIWNDEVSLFLSFIVGLEPELEDSLWNTANWCIDNKITDWTFNGLFIYADTTRSWTSEFDREHEKYGYHFDNPEEPGNWRSDHWTATTAKNVANQLTHYSAPHRKMSTWHLFDASNLGYKLSELSDYNLLNTEEFKIKFKTFIQQYYYRLWNRK